MDSLPQVAKALPISRYDIVSAADMEEFIGKRVAKPSVEDTTGEEEHEEEERDEPIVFQF